ncbi:MAG: class I SAM-dependent methyltransferase [Pseudorhodoplanes sp.]|nr:MAG: class I SAM-dependent methyltransferase [Pseudorhodoplanes sp.]
MPETIVVTPNNHRQALAGLPRAMRAVLGLAARIACGTLEVRLADGRTFVFRGTHHGPAAMVAIRSERLAWRLLRSGDIGIAESYLRGEWETPDLTQLLYLFCVNVEAMQAIRANPVTRWLQGLRHWLNRNTRRQARRNIHAHYDLGNEFYRAWLDPTMTYSSALFDQGSSDLAAAQVRKYESLAQQIALAPDHHVLEIGCGWGGFAEYAAKTVGARVTGLTISRAQYDYARKRMFEAGLADKVTIKLQDYRDESGRYDRIASIEMIEAVGEEFWPDYFRQIRDRLAAGGIAGIQAITIQERFFANYRREIDYIRRYIFPGGMLPSPTVLRALGERFGLPLVTEKVFGEDYARTLAVWRERFRSAWPSLVPLGFDERFRRLWEYYLAYCEAGFLSRNIDVRQMIFAKTG